MKIKNLNNLELKMLKLTEEKLMEFNLRELLAEIEPEFSEEQNHIMLKDLKSGADTFVFYPSRLDIKMHGNALKKHTKKVVAFLNNTDYLLKLIDKQEIVKKEELALKMATEEFIEQNLSKIKEEVKKTVKSVNSHIEEVEGTNWNNGYRIVVRFKPIKQVVQQVVFQLDDKLKVQTNSGWEPIKLSQIEGCILELYHKNLKYYKKELA